MLPDTILRIADEVEFPWLLQPELKAIVDGLIYVEEYVEDNEGKYRGYLNAKGQRQGVGIANYGYMTLIGEWHENNLHGIAKNYFHINHVSEWGQFKHGKREGYLTTKYSDGRVNYYQFKNGDYNGYGI